MKIQLQIQLLTRTKQKRGKDDYEEEVELVTTSNFVVKGKCR